MLYKLFSTCPSFSCSPNLLCFCGNQSTQRRFDQSEDTQILYHPRPRRHSWVLASQELPKVVFLGSKGLESRMLRDDRWWLEMKKDKVQEISAWDGMESTRPDSSLGREGTSIASPDVALGKAPLGRPVRVWPSSGPQSCVIYIPDVLSTSKCLPRNQELRTNSPRHQRVKGL